VKSVSYTKAFEMPIPVADLFSLFSPEGEKLWVPGWEYENLMGTTELSEDDVFLTKNHDHGTTEAIWIVKRYDPRSHIVQYYKIEPGDKIGIITVQCTVLEARRTKIEVTYKYTALAASGEKFVSRFSESVYEQFIGEWQSLLTDFFNAKGGESEGEDG